MRDSKLPTLLIASLSLIALLITPIKASAAPKFVLYTGAIGAIGAGSNKAVIGNSSLTDVYLGSSNGDANAHAKKLFLGSPSIPGCIVMGDTAGGVGYVTLTSGVLTVSSTPPSACQ